MGDWLASLGQHWIWLTIGLLLAAVEILAPGFFLMWLGAAAILVGILVWLVPGTIIPMQVGLFAIFAILSVYIGKRFLNNNPIQTTDPMLNNQTAQLIGEVVTLTEAISNGRGRAKVGDGAWNVRGPDAPVGARVRITGAEGAELLVEVV
jgi:inner membrane protein